MYNIILTALCADNDEDDNDDKNNHEQYDCYDDDYHSLDIVILSIHTCQWICNTLTLTASTGRRANKVVCITEHWIQWKLKRLICCLPIIADIILQQQTDLRRLSWHWVTPEWFHPTNLYPSVMVHLFTNTLITCLEVFLLFSVGVSLRCNSYTTVYCGIHERSECIHSRQWYIHC